MPLARRFFTLVLFFVCFIQFSQAQIPTVQDGLWNSPSTWQGGTVPAPGANIVIEHNVTLDVNVVVNDLSITLGSLNTGSFTIDIQAGFSAAGGFSGSGTVNFVGGVPSFITASASINFHNLTISKTSGVATLDQHVIVNNNLTINSGTLNANNVNIDIFNGSFINNGIFQPGTGIVNFRTGIQSIGGTGTGGFNILSVNSSTGVVSLQRNIVVNDINIVQGVFDAGTYGINVNNNFMVGSFGSFQTGTGTVTFAGSTDQNISASSPILFNILRVLKPSGTLFLLSDIIVNNHLHIQSGTLDASFNNIDMWGNLTNDATFYSSATVRFDGPGDKLIEGASPIGTSFNDLVIGGTGVVKANHRIFAGSSTIIETNSKLDLGIITMHELGNLIGTGTLALSAAPASTALLPGAMTFYASFSGPIEYNSPNSYNIGDPLMDYPHLIISGGGTKTMALSGNFNVTNNFTVQNDFPTTFNYSSTGTLNVYGDLVNHGTINTTAGAGITVHAGRLINNGTLTAQGDLQLYGTEFHNNGTFASPPGSNFYFRGLSDQAIMGSVKPDFANLYVDLGSPGMALSINQPTRITEQLIFDGYGKVRLGMFDLELAPSATISVLFDPDNMIEFDGSPGGGHLVKEANSDADFIMNYPLGISGTYSPLEITGINMTPSGIATIRMKPVLYSPVPAPSDYIGRFISLQSANMTSVNNFSFSFYYPQAEEFGLPSDVYRYVAGTPNPAIPSAVDYTTNFYGVSGATIVDGDWICETLSIPPVISSLSVPNACVGDSIDILGSGFTTTLSVTFPGPVSAGFVVKNDGLISVEVPPGTLPGNLTVTNSFSSANSPSGFAAFTPPTIFSLADMQTCSATPVALGVSFSGATMVLWSNSGGDGSFDDVNSTNPTYTPGPNDELNGSVTIQVTTVDGCAPQAFESFLLTIVPVPSASISGNQSVCDGSSALLTVNLSGGTGPWDFEYSDGTNTFQEFGASFSPYNLSVFPTGNTTYTLVSVTENGCTGTVSGSATVTVLPPADALLSGDQTICTGGTATLTVDFTGIGPWDFTYNDGSTDFPMSAPSTPFTFDVTPTTTTTYVITSLMDNGCPSMAAPMPVTVTVVSGPTVSVGGDLSVCENNPAAALSGSVTLATGGVWSNGGGVFSPNATTLNAVYTPSSAEITAGLATLILTSTGNGSCTAEDDTLLILITSAPTVTAASTNASVCTSSPDISLNGTVAGASTFSWSGGGGTFNPNPNTLNAIYSPTAAEISGGNASLTLTANSPGCLSVSDMVVVPITSGPTVNAGPDQTVCASATSVSLNGSVTIATGGTWTGSGTGTFSPNANTLSVNYIPSGADVTAGFVTLTLTSSGNGACPAANAQMTITFSSGPDINLSVSPTEDTLCAGADGLLTITASEAGVMYVPELGGSAIGTGVAGTGGDINLNIPNAGIVAGLDNMISIRATLAGCTPVLLTSGATIRKSDLAPPAIAASAGAQLCTGSPVDLSVPAVFTTYQWFHNGSRIVGAAGDSYSTVTSGTYSVEVNDGLCTVLSGTRTVNYVSPEPVVSLSGTSLTTASASAYYQWYVRRPSGSVAIHGANSSSLPVYFNGEYFVAINYNNCRLVSLPFTLSNPSLNPLLRQNYQVLSDSSIIIFPPSEGETEVYLYPNPAENAFTVDYISAASEPVLIELFNSMGGKVLSRSVPAGTGRITEVFENLNLRAGIYLISVTEGGKRVVRNIQIN